MKIIYNQNPLATVVELDDNDRKILKKNIQIDELENIIIEIGYHVEEKHSDLLKARKIYEEYLSGTFSKKINDLIICMENELKTSHFGDCTRFACSCDKCHAESMIEIDTTPKLKSYMGYYIMKVFENKEITTCDQAIEQLEKPLVLDPKHETYHAEWIQQNKDTVEWLKNYKKTYL